MRDVLRPLEGKLVIARGRKKTIERNSDGTINVLLKAVQIRPFDPSVSMRKIDPIRVDHLWQRGMDPEQIDGQRLLTRCCGFGRIVWYERVGPGRAVNGAVDLTVQCLGP